MEKNKFTRTIRKLKSNSINEKLQLINEIPTNNTGGIYVVEPSSTEIVGENIDAPLDLTQDDPTLNGRDTTGLFGEDGSILTIEPPGDTSYILGPMMSMWYSWGNFSTIGYVRQSDRRMVDLGRITGRISNWDGSSNFTSYGQLTLAQAQWYREQYSGGNTEQYRAFYPGPPSNPRDEFGRYLGDIINKAKELAREVVRRIPPIMGPWDPNIVPGSANPNNKKKSEWDKYLESLPPEVRDDLLKGGNTASPLGDLAILGLTAAAVKGALAAGIGSLLKGVSAVSIGSQIKPLFGDANSSSDYNKQLASKLVDSILSGQPREIKLSNAAKTDQIKNVNVQQFGDALTFGSAPKPSAESTINPGNKRPVFTGGWGAQGGSEVHYDPKTDTLTFTSEKTLRTGQPGDKFDSSGRQTSFGDIPSPSQEKVNDITKQLLGNGIVDNLLGGLGNIMTPVTGGQNAWNQIKNDPIMLNNFVNNLSTAANNIATGGVQGTASNTVALRDALTKIGIPKSAVEQIGGGYGQVFSQTSYSGNEIPSELRNVINSRLPRSSSGFKVVGEEKRTRSILKNIKKPYVLPEEPKVKIKHRPKVIGSDPRVVNSDLMKKAEVPSSFVKPEERLWGKYEKNRNARMSQERKNEILDHLGGSDHFWEYMTETSRQKSNDIMYGNFGGEEKKAKVVRKEELKGDTLLFITDENGKKESILQSELSIRLADEFNKELFQKYFQEQETIKADKDPLFKKVSKRLKKEIDYPDKPSKKGYPNEPPPKMVNGWHPEYGKDKGYYDKLDPHSAEAIPETGDSEIDTQVKVARKKSK